MSEEPKETPLSLIKTRIDKRTGKRYQELDLQGKKVAIYFIDGNCLGGTIEFYGREELVIDPIAGEVAVVQRSSVKYMVAYSNN